MADLTGKVVVLTGATSGIGRATAQRLARRGATIVLAARRAEVLGDVLRECETAGATALAVPTDVAVAGDVDRLASTAERSFGRIDAWVNDASVAAYGRLEDIPAEEIRRLLDVNVMGYVLGMQEALRRFRAQGHGTIVNVASLVSYVGTPYLAPYVLSKHAVHGLSTSVRMELRGERRIHVCDVFPGAVDTPFFQHAANHSGRTIKAPNPTIRPEAVARAVVGCIARPRTRRAVGVSTRLLIANQRLLPRLTERVTGLVMRRDEFGRGGEAPTSGNLFEPAADGGPVRGGWRGGVQGVARKAAVPAAIAAGVVVARNRAA